jgi:hypothetical protein
MFVGGLKMARRGASAEIQKNPYIVILTRQGGARRAFLAQILFTSDFANCTGARG